MHSTFKEKKKKKSWSFQVKLKMNPGKYPRGASLVAQMVKDLPAMQEDRVRSLSWEDSLEEDVAIHFHILAQKIPDRDAWQAAVHKIKESQTQLSDLACMQVT